MLNWVTRCFFFLSRYFIVSRSHFQAALLLSSLFPSCILFSTCFIQCNFTRYPSLFLSLKTGLLTDVCREQLLTIQGFFSSVIRQAGALELNRLGSQIYTNFSFLNLYRWVFLMCREHKQNPTEQVKVIQNNCGCPTPFFCLALGCGALPSNCSSFQMQTVSCQMWCWKSWGFLKMWWQCAPFCNSFVH